MSATLTQQMVFKSCPECGINYGIPEALLESRLRDRSTFYCPNGHHVWFPKGQTYKELQHEIIELKERVAGLVHQRERAEARRESDRPPCESPPTGPALEPKPGRREKTSICFRCGARKPSRGFQNARKLDVDDADYGDRICPECVAKVMA